MTKRYYSAHRDMLNVMEGMEVGHCLMGPLAERKSVHSLQQTVSRAGVGKAFRTHYYQGKFFIVRVG